MTDNPVDNQQPYPIYTPYVSRSSANNYTQYQDYPSRPQFFPSSSSGNEFKIYNEDGTPEPSRDAKEVPNNRRQALKLVLVPKHVTIIRINKLADELMTT